MYTKFELAEMRQAYNEIKIQTAKIHKSPEFDRQVVLWLNEFHKNYLLFSYLRKFCRSTRAKNRQELLIKKILYIIFINRDYKIDNFGPKIDYLDLIVGAESRSLCSDWGLKKEDYILLDIVGADIWLKHGWDTNWDLQYGLSHSSKELDLYKRGVPEVDLINDFVFTVVDKFK